MKPAGGLSGRRNCLPSGWPTAEFISSPAEKHARLPRRFLLNSRVNKSERQARLCLFAPGYATTTGSTERFQKLGSSKEKPVFERNKKQSIERAAGQVPEEARQEWLAMLQ